MPLTIRNRIRDLFESRIEDVYINVAIADLLNITHGGVIRVGKNLSCEIYYSLEDNTYMAALDGSQQNGIQCEEYFVSAMGETFEKAINQLLNKCWNDITFYDSIDEKLLTFYGEGIKKFLWDYFEPIDDQPEKNFLPETIALHERIASGELTEYLRESAETTILSPAETVINPDGTIIMGKTFSVIHKNEKPTTIIDEGGFAPFNSEKYTNVNQ